ncbi:hypothetical protein NP493_3766g00002 [Ridgeia piscesae]|uniref:Uncharacterized protein n=1 Tax=Ridgeia piscesae TaxID=27915 RepID=A0AAD9MUP1_RIDPI|nr:hypothetical protein NP493_3766g00002 [Ridgeia piscesae]
MLGLLNQDPPLVDHDHEHDHSAWLSGRGLDVTGEACGTQSCPVIPQYGSRSLVDELLDRPKTRSPPTQLLVPTRQSHEVPVLFREAYIENGFRAINQPWQYYVCSFFQLHNESMNVWTHFLAAYLMAKKLVVFSQYIDFWNDTYSWTFLTGLGSATLMYATSTGAHWFQSHSEFIYYLSFMLDYASIGLYSFSSVMLHYTYSADKQVYEYMRDIYQPIGAILGFLTCFCSVVGLVLLRLEYPRARKACQTIPVAFIYILLVSPILHRIYMCQIHDMECELSIDLHTQQIIWFLLSALFFVSHFPQCVLPAASTTSSIATRCSTCASL